MNLYLSKKLSEVFSLFLMAFSPYKSNISRIRRNILIAHLYNRPMLQRSNTDSKNASLLKPKTSTLLQSKTLILRQIFRLVSFVTIKTFKLMSKSKCFNVPLLFPNSCAYLYVFQEYLYIRFVISQDQCNQTQWVTSNIHILKTHNLFLRGIACRSPNRVQHRSQTHSHKCAST